MVIIKCYFIYNLTYSHHLILIRLNLVSTRHNFIVTKLTVFNIMGVYFFIVENLFKLLSQLTRLKLLHIVPLLLLIIVGIYSQMTNYYIKYIYLILFISFFYPKINLVVNQIYFHIVMLSSLTIWLVFFTFFFIFYKEQFNFFITSLNFFEYSLNSKYLIFNTNYLGNFLETLSFSTHSFLQYTIMNTSSIQISILLNNGYLLHLIILVTLFF